jgi:hypothetical protein
VLSWGFGVVVEKVIVRWSLGFPKEPLAATKGDVNGSGESAQADELKSDAEHW